jgi:SagB-type dehydrogenase family enzyme
MTSAGSTETRWPAGLRLRPAADLESPEVEVTDAATGRRFHWPPETLSAHILRDDTDLAALDDGDAWKNALKTSGDRRELIPDWRHWQHRRWHPSDHYYLTSRQDGEAREADTDMSIRLSMLDLFLLADGPPPEEHRPCGPVLSLGTPPPLGEQEISRLLVTRRTGRSYIRQAPSLESLSGLLWYGLSGVRAGRSKGDRFDPATYLDCYGAAWDFYLCVYKVDGVEPGVYRYDLLDHELVGVRPGDHRDAMIDVLQGMHSPATAAWTLGLVADFPRYQWRYRHEHGLRRLYLEAGVLAQQLIVLAMSYGLSTLVTPAQKDRAYLELHDLPEDRFAPVYTLTMGLSRGTAGVGFDNAPGAS